MTGHYQSVDKKRIRCSIHFQDTSKLTARNENIHGMMLFLHLPESASSIVILKIVSIFPVPQCISIYFNKCFTTPKKNNKPHLVFAKSLTAGVTNTTYSSRSSCGRSSGEGTSFSSFSQHDCQSYCEQTNHLV